MSMDYVAPAGSASLPGAQTPIDGLREEIEGIRAQIAECLLEIDTITLQINPQIESDYAVKIGCYENELYQCQLAARRARRKYMLAQARKNSGSAIAESAIEEQLDEEFAAWEAKLDALVAAWMRTLEKRATSRPLSPGESRELKQKHRDLIKRLHPDMRPDLGEEGERFFLIVQAAFKSGDLDTLRAVEAATAHLEREPQQSDDENELFVERELLEAQLHVTAERLEQLKLELPYALREKLADADWVHRKVSELKRQIEEQKQVKQMYDARFRELAA